jgi:hypothetical protein
MNYTSTDIEITLENYGNELGETFSFDERGECELLFENALPILIRKEGDLVTIAAAIAHGVTDGDDSFLASLMAYQWLGIKTGGCLLSWNDKGGTIVVSQRMVPPESPAMLREALETVIATARSIQDDIAAGILNKVQESPEPAEKDGYQDFIKYSTRA